jgi:hypothetical protein
MNLASLSVAFVITMIFFHAYGLLSELLIACIASV